MKKQPEHQTERDFVANFFDHDEWEYEPRRFSLGCASYTPDFYDKKRDVYIEVIGTRQRFSMAKYEYALFAIMYPNIKYELRNPDGSLHRYSQLMNKRDLTRRAKAVDGIWSEMNQEKEA